MASFLRGFFSEWVWDWDTARYFRQFCFYASPLLLVQLIQYGSQNLKYPYHAPRLVRLSLGTLLTGVAVISLLVGLPHGNQFIYFQF
jgi:hypothetical protein